MGPDFHGPEAAFEHIGGIFPLMRDQAEQLDFPISSPFLKELQGEYVIVTLPPGISVMDLLLKDPTMFDRSWSDWVRTGGYPFASTTGNEWSMWAIRKSIAGRFSGNFCEFLSHDDADGTFASQKWRFLRGYEKEPPVLVAAYAAFIHQKETGEPLLSGGFARCSEQYTDVFGVMQRVCIGTDEGRICFTGIPDGMSGPNYGIATACPPLVLRYQS
jgi:hypothetical protein